MTYLGAYFLIILLVITAFPQVKEPPDQDREKYGSLIEGLNFTVSEKGDLKLANRFTNTLAFTKNGIFPVKNVGDPVFTVGQSVSKFGVGDTEQFARSLIFETITVTGIKIEQSNKVIIDNLNGYEMIARGKDIKSAQPMVIYQTMLFEGQGYYIMRGVITSKQREAYLRVFKEMRGSFKRR
jgi:hypothetical protein